MSTEGIVNELKASKEFLDRSTSVLEESDSGFAPKEGMFTAAQQIAHIAQTAEWFMEGGFGKGFDLDFEAHIREFSKYTSLTEARAYCDRAYANAIKIIASKTMEELMEPLPDGPIMGGAPKLAIPSSIAEHTAHHRGVLTVYSRLLGKVPAMPYMDAAPSN